MKLKQITISIENSHGRLFDVSNALAQEGINLRALNLVDTGAFGQLRLLVSDLPKARRILMEKHLPARIDEVVAAEITDKPGALAELLKCLLDTQINVIYSYAFIGYPSGNAVMIFRFNDNDKAIEILQHNGFKLLDAEAFGVIDS